MVSIEEINQTIGFLDNLEKYLMKSDLEAEVSNKARTISHELKYSMNAWKKNVSKYLGYTILRKKMEKYVKDENLQNLPLDNLPNDIQSAVNYFGGLDRAYRGLAYRIEDLKSKIYDESKMSFNYAKSLDQVLSKEMPTRGLGYRLRQMLETVFYGERFSHRYDSHTHKFALLAIVLTSFGAASWLWVWKTLQEPVSVSAVITASPTFTPLNILLSVAIFAGLVYSVEHLERELKKQ